MVRLFLGGVGDSMPGAAMARTLQPTRDKRHQLAVSNNHDGLALGCIIPLIILRLRFGREEVARSRRPARDLYWLLLLRAGRFLKDCHSLLDNT